MSPNRLAPRERTLLLQIKLPESLLRAVRRAARGDNSLGRRGNMSEWLRRALARAVTDAKAGRRELRARAARYARQ